MAVIGHLSFIFQSFVRQGYQYNLMQYFLLQQEAKVGKIFLGYQPYQLVKNYQHLMSDIRHTVMMGTEMVPAV
jgi:hypothetical protein